MPSAAIKDKVEKLEKIRIRARAIMSEHEKNGTGYLPPEEEMQCKTLTEEALKLREEIDKEEKLEQQKADLADLDRYLDEPQRRVPHGVNDNADTSERKQLERAGWEFKSGMAFKQTSTGTSVPMFSEKVLFGEIPTRDASAAEFYRTTRAAMGHDYKTAYEHYIQLVAMAPEGAAYSMLTSPEQKALSEGTDTAGGFLVPPDVQAELLARVAQRGVLRQHATVQPTNRDTLRWPAVKAHATQGSIYSSGFVGGWAGETPAFTDTDPSFQTLDISIKKLRVATRLSNDFVSDASVNILSYLAQNGAENMALTEDQGFLLGDGTALQPLGLLNAGLTTVDVEGSTANTITNTTSSAGSAPKLIDVAYNLPAQYTGNARWIMRRTIEGKIRKLVDGSGRYMWPPFTGSAFAGPVPDLLGFPVLHSDWLADDGTDANKVVLLGDLSQYIIGQRTQITSTILRERFADVDQVGILLWERVGGGIFNTDAIRVGIV